MSLLNFRLAPQNASLLIRPGQRTCGYSGVESVSAVRVSATSRAWNWKCRLSDLRWTGPEPAEPTFTPGASKCYTFWEQNSSPLSAHVLPPRRACGCAPRCCIDGAQGKAAHSTSVMPTESERWESRPLSPSRAFALCPVQRPLARPQRDCHPSSPCTVPLHWRS